MLTLRGIGETAAVVLISVGLLPLPLISHAQGRAVPRRLRRAPSVRTLPARLPTAPSTASAPQTSGPEKAGPAASRLRPPSLLDDPPQPASVEFQGKLLAIRAKNSSLNAILKEVASKSGMKIEGLGSDERVFGNFGPGTPHDILAELLNGTPYDVLMVGVLENGSPKQMILSAASSGPPAGSQPAPVPPAATSYRDERQPIPATSAFPPQPPVQRIQTPQELFRELQAIRERQQQQGQQQGQQQQ